MEILYIIVSIIPFIVFGFFISFVLNIRKRALKQQLANALKCKVLAPRNGVAVILDDFGKPYFFQKDRFDVITPLKNNDWLTFYPNK